MLIWMQTVILPVLTVFMGSAGLWSYIQGRRQSRTADDTKQAETMEHMKLLIMGLGYDVIVSRGMGYITRGWITKDEYEDFVKLFYTPYKNFGGNGVAEQVMAQVRKLPFNNPRLYFELKQPLQQEYDNDGWTTSRFDRHSIEQPRL